MLGVDMRTATRARHNYSNLDPQFPPDSANDESQYVRVFGRDIAMSRPFINIGAGNWRHPLWQNMDHAVPPYDQYGEPDINLNLAEKARWPIDDGSIKLLYSSHTLEHLTDDVNSYVFEEALRVLDRGGVFRIVVPDMELALYAYLLNDYTFFDTRNASAVKGDKVVLTSRTGYAGKNNLDASFLGRFASCLGRPTVWEGRPLGQALREAFAGEDLERGCRHFLVKADFATKNPRTHINWFSGERLCTLLREAGFSLAIRTGYGQSLSPLMRNKFYFDRTRPSESLYVDAVK
jgi:hypothetical protein